MTLRLKNIVTIVCLILLTGLKSFAAEEPYENFIKGAIKKNDSLFVKDEKFKNPLFIWSDITNISVRNTISLSILNEQEIAKDFKLKVTLRVEYFSSPTQIEPTRLDSVQLNVNYAKGQGTTFKSVDHHHFSDGYYVKVYVVDVESQELGTEIPEIFQLSSTIVIDRQYKFIADMPISMEGVMVGEAASGNGLAQRLSSGTMNTAKTQLELSWTPLPSGYEYDIEWVTLDKTAANTTVLTSLVNNSFNSTDEVIGQFFKNNSTRITTVVPNYTISLLSNADVILVRIRQVNYIAGGIRIEGAWSYKQDNPVKYTAWDLTWHEAKMNWQYSASYAEEGKKKEVVTYFDGTLRGRQTVTLNNADNVAIVQENVYDKYGRVAASILPAPYRDLATTKQYLRFYKNFNLNSDLKPYNFANLDSACEISPQVLSMSSGASFYYSPENTFKNTNERNYDKFIPNAGGFPLSVTQYTADNTGRIKLQGGVGSVFQPGSANSKTTKYYYAKPGQWELDRLFGNDVGTADHYLKNMVVDPNQQVSISYLNASGKTIATALTGPKPANVEALSSLPEVKLDTIPLFASNKFVFNSTALTLTATTTHLADVIGTSTLKFNIEQLIHQYQVGTFQAKSNCYYELNITIKDDCQNVIKTFKRDHFIGSETYNATKIGLYEESFDVDFLKIGEYYITIEYSLSRDVVRYYTNKFITDGQANGSIKKEKEFVLLELGKMNFADCLSDCKTAVQNLGGSTAFTTMFNAKLTEMGVTPADYSSFVTGLYNTLSATAIALSNDCNTTSNPCEQYRRMMIEDVSPGGQYALFDAAGLALEQDLNVLLKGFHTTVFTGNLPSSHEDYKATQVTLADGSISSPYASSFTLAQLVQYWRPEWAELFLPLHPEYCKLQFCITNSGSANWDEKIQQVNTAAEISSKIASGAAYSDTNNAWLVPYDPFFSGAGSGYASSMTADLNNYSTNVLKLNVRFPNAVVKGLSKYVDYQLYCADSLGTTNQFGQPSNRWDNCAKNTACRVIDREWQMYRDMYLELKQKYFEMLRSATTCSSNCEVAAPIGLTVNNGAGTAPCGNSLYLTTYGAQLSDTKFTNNDVYNNQLYTYTFVSGVPGNAPPAGSICSTEAPVFYSCITVYLPNNVLKKLYNVWMYTCIQATTPSCNNSGTIFYTESMGPYLLYINYGGYQTRDVVTLYPGYTSSTYPQFDYCYSSYDVAFYDCLTVYNVYSGYTQTHYNVWAQTCYDVYTGTMGRQSNIAGDSIPATRVASPGLTPMQKILEANNFNDTDKKDQELVLADISKNEIYSIVKDSTQIISAESTVPGVKSQFTGYEFKAYFAVQTAKNNFRTFTNVWVANYVSTVKSKSNIAAKSMESASVQSISAPSCISSDFYAAYPSWQGNGIHLVVGYSNNVSCSNAAAPVEIYIERFGEWYYLGSSIIPAGQVSVEQTYSFPNYLPSYDTFWVCGVRPCTSGGSVPCSPLLSTKISRFGVPGRSDVSGTNGTQIYDEQQGELHNLIQSSCEAGAEIWMERFAAGLQGKEALDIALLKSKLIELCAAGGDLSHPMGASSLPNGGFIIVRGQQCSNFGAVISAIFGSFNPLLNPWLIETPYPHGSGHQPVERIITNTSPDICARLGALRSPGMTDAQFYTSLQTTFGTAMKLSLADFQLLLEACGNCRYLLKKDLVLPSFLEANSITCVTRTAYNDAMTQLNSASVFNGTLTSSSDNYETIVSNYLNFKWGFSLPYDRYASFATGTATTLCNETPYTELPATAYACEKSLIELAVGNGKRQYLSYVEEEKRKFLESYVAFSASAKASARLLVRQQIYHYTLYYYDQAGNLIRTVPPEGVNVLNESQTRMVDKARQFSITDCTYSGPVTAASKPTALQNLSSTIAYQGNAAVELWLYQNNGSSQQMIATTPDLKYIFQACINGGLLNIDVYSLNQESAGNITITLSNHVTANIQALQPVLPWNHIVVQGNKLGTGALQLWVNGKLYPAVPGAPSAGCSWGISTSPSLVTPENIANLKHMRLYTGRLLGADEILKNAESGCFNANGVYTQWYRFGIPAAGTETTIAANSTQETQFKLLYPLHNLATTYAYNSGNQVIRQQSPDGGTSRFWYDRLGRLIISQNAKQAASDKYSYTRYEEILGRITEVGEKTVNNATLKQADQLESPGYLEKSFYDSFLASGSNAQLTQTKYDFAPSVVSGVPSGLVLQNLRKRVVSSTYRETAGDNNINASYYNYDLSGNVKTLYQQVAGLGVKKIDYEYDLASGKVNFVAYQHGQRDRFYYGYNYDAENRLTKVWSSITANVVSYGFGSTLDFSTKKLDASYAYYLHGPLARMELGRESAKVQGLDYAYTLQGWLKGVNGNTLETTKDQGGDGATIGRDAVAYTLSYYPGDYSPIGAANPYNMQWQPGGETGAALYNGNISASTVAIKGIDSDKPTGYSYGYDQLNRLVKMRQHDNLTNTTSTWSEAGSQKYKENYSYDGNGNILNLQRNGPTGSMMDNLSYTYNRDANGKLLNNRLASLGDAVSGAAQSGELAGGTGSYGYDAIGNLVSDSREGITGIDWNVYGKIKSISKGAANTTYNYDPSGNRVSKVVGDQTTWYVRDAQGNSLAVYDKKGTGPIKWSEQHLYGSSRLGMWRPNFNLAFDSVGIRWNESRLKFFELSNHLGNVLAVIDDDAPVSSNVKEPRVLSAQDYYPFGMIQPGRTLTSEKYRYGFNGKENDNDVKGVGNQQDYGMRIYDPRVGRFLSVDPITADYPMLTPYQFASNRPIDGIDFDGLEFIKPRGWLEGADQAGPVLAGFVNLTANTVIGSVNAVAGTVTGVKDGTVYLYKAATKQRNIGHDIRSGINGVSSNVREFLSKPIQEQARIAGNALTSPDAYAGAVGFFALGGGKTFFRGAGVAEAAASLESSFAKGGSKLVSSEMLARYPNSPTIGLPSETFIAPTSEINALLESGLSRKDLAIKLGIVDNKFLEGDLIRVDVSPSTLKKLNLRPTMGNEVGANSQYIPGGKTSGGVTEGVVNGVPKKGEGVKISTIKDK